MPPPPPPGRSKGLSLSRSGVGFTGANTDFLDAVGIH